MRARPAVLCAIVEADETYRLESQKGSQNGVPTTRTGLEFGTKTAFTFLPWRLRYLGFDGNYTKLGSVTSTQNIVDLLTGTPLPPLRESKFQYNWAFWYDDGRLSARVAVQGVAS